MNNNIKKYIILSISIVLQVLVAIMAIIAVAGFCGDYSIEMNLSPITYYIWKTTPNLITSVSYLGTFLICLMLLFLAMNITLPCLKKELKPIGKKTKIALIISAIVALIILVIGIILYCVSAEDKISNGYVLCLISIVIFACTAIYYESLKFDFPILNSISADKFKIISYVAMGVSALCIVLSIVAVCVANASAVYTHDLITIDGSKFGFVFTMAIITPIVTYASAIILQKFFAEKLAK